MRPGRITVEEVQTAPDKVGYLVTAPTGFAALAGHKYITLETFRRNGQGVQTPVWFAADPSVNPSAPPAVYVYTIGATGKVKRIRNNPRVRIAPSTARGKPLGDWLDATAQIVTGSDAARGMRLLNQKYFPWKQLLGFFASFSRRDRVVIALHPA